MKEKQLESAFINTGFTHNGITYKPLTAQSILFLKMANSPLYTGEVKENHLEAILDYLFVSSQPKTAIKAALDDWQDAILDFSGNYSTEDLSALTPLVMEAMGINSAPLVEVREDEQKKTEMTQRG